MFREGPIAAKRILVLWLIQTLFASFEHSMNRTFSLIGLGPNKAMNRIFTGYILSYGREETRLPIP